MNKIKDIIYNKSDIIIALLILAIAALIIFWRLGIILQYPKDIVGGNDTENVLTDPTGEDGEVAGDDQTDDQSDDQSGDQTGDDQADDQTDDQADDQTDDQTGDDQTGDKTDDQADDKSDDKADEPEQTASGPQWDGDKLAADYEVTLTGTTAYAAVQCMVEAGIFEDYAEYQKICQENGYDHEKMRAGVFTFKKGSTKLDMIKIVNWSKG